MEAKLESGDYTKFIIDLRNNGGGSDGVLYPITYLAQQFVADGHAAYVLAGEGTFSSALINTVQLKDVGATFVGTPTGGSVDHFGAVTAFELPNSGIRGQYSNKLIDLGSYYQTVWNYGIESFRPDIEVGQTFADYMDGVDTAVQYILDSAPVRADTSLLTCPRLKRKAALLAMSLALMGSISSSTARLFSLSVVPVSTMSTMTSERPSMGASSMEPLSFIISMVLPRF